MSKKQHLRRRPGNRAALCPRAGIDDADADHGEKPDSGFRLRDAPLGAIDFDYAKLLNGELVESEAISYLCGLYREKSYYSLHRHLERCKAEDNLQLEICDMMAMHNTINMDGYQSDPPDIPEGDYIAFCFTFARPLIMPIWRRNFGRIEEFIRRYSLFPVFGEYEMLDLDFNLSAVPDVMRIYLDRLKGSFISYGRLKENMGVDFYDPMEIIPGIVFQTVEDYGMCPVCRAYDDFVHECECDGYTPVGYRAEQQQFRMKEEADFTDRVNYVIENYIALTNIIKEWEKLK